MSSPVPDETSTFVDINIKWSDQKVLTIGFAFKRHSFNKHKYKYSFKNSARTYISSFACMFIP